MSTTRLVSIIARKRDLNARGRGSDTYAMVGLPGSGRLVWADTVPGATVIRDTYPRSRGRLAAERHGSQLIRVELPIGAVVVFIDKHTDGRTSRTAVRLDVDAGEMTRDGQAVRASTLPYVSVASRRAASGGWVTVVDGEEYA